ncbi:hypothetical protein [Methylomonas rivi]|uniref:Uncharacterized protein n=1 Tax=Methylomonas rivi TaxID=2952226 RepID=A0ABT1U8G5_9GAMM|nr:hypothetical protein [Methylomonas sp. WSC-6]MCQ8129813.1 hypothetical protein [Methylomonas sp. WSC-6]
MICEISGQRLVISEKVLLVADSQRAAVEAALRSCGCKAEWSQAVSALETYNDFSEGNGVSVWAMSLTNKEDAKKVQSALDAVEQPYESF